MSFADLEPGQNAVAVRDHWWWRPGWQVGRRFYAFHVTFGDNRDLQQLTETYRRPLGGIETVALVPSRWLHLTMQGIGFTDEVSEVAVREIADRAGEELGRIPAFDIELGDVVVADEAIVMPAEPAFKIGAVRALTRTAIGGVLGEEHTADDPSRYRPHVSFGYFTVDGPAGPYVDAVSSIHPLPVRIRIDHIDLIEMHRDNRMYEWTTVTTLSLDRRSVCADELSE